MTPTNKQASTRKKAAPKTKAVSKKKPTNKTPEVKNETPVSKTKASAEKNKTDLLQSYGDFTPYNAAENEEYMNDAQIEHFRKILTAWKQELMQEVDRTVHYMQDEAANFPDPNDRATQESDFTMELRARDRERKLIKKIEEAIENLGSGDYGFCEACGIDVGIRRLEARPTATLCIDCKTLDEIKERQKGG